MRRNESQLGCDRAAIRRLEHFLDGLTCCGARLPGPEPVQPSRFQPGQEVPDDHSRVIRRARRDPAGPHRAASRRALRPVQR